MRVRAKAPEFRKAAQHAAPSRAVDRLARAPRARAAAVRRGKERAPPGAPLDASRSSSTSCREQNLKLTRQERGESDGARVTNAAGLLESEMSKCNAKEETDRFFDEARNAFSEDRSALGVSSERTSGAC